MTEENETVATEAEESVAASSSAPAAEASSAQEPSLDELLEQFETKTVEPPATQDKAEFKPEEAKSDKTEDRVYKEYIERQIQKEADRDLMNAVKMIKDTADIPLPDRHVRAILEDKAKEDARILSAWNKRNTAPKVFEDVMRAIGRELAKELEMPIDQTATNSVNAVTSAVHSGKTQAPMQESAPDVWKMSEAEWHKLKAQAESTILS